MSDTTTLWPLEARTSAESVDDASNCFNRTTNSGFTANFVIFKKSVNIYFVGLAILFGLVGNTLSVVVLRHDRQADAKQRSSTNYLLRMLAIVDSLYLVTCFFIQTLKTIIENTEWFPGSPLRYHYLHSEPLVWMLSSAAQTSTVWLVLLVTLDRYLAVCKPWKSRWRTPRFVATAVATLAILALMYNLPRFFERVVITRRLCTSRLTHDHLPIDGLPLQNYSQSLLVESNLSAIAQSNIKAPSTISDASNHSLNQTRLQLAAIRSSESLNFITRTLRTDFRNNKIYFLVYKTVMYFVFRSFGPLIMMLFCNVRLVFDLRKVRKRRRDMLSRRVQHKENITVMLVVVVTVFIICQIPALGVRVAVTIMEFNHDIHLDLQILRYINELSNAMLTVNSAINFIIYCLVGKKFQKSFMSIISCAARTADVGTSEEGSKTMALNRSTVVSKCQQQPHLKDSKQVDMKMTESFIFNGSTICTDKDRHGSVLVQEPQNSETADASDKHVSQ